MAIDVTEKGLETLIVDYLVKTAGYAQGHPTDYDREHAVDLQKLTGFIRNTQPETFDALSLSEDSPRRTKFLHRLQGEIAKRGIINVLRMGIDDGPVHADLFYGTPSPQNSKARELYSKNIFSVTRQLRYSMDEVQLALDLAVFTSTRPERAHRIFSAINQRRKHTAVFFHHSLKYNR